MPIAPAATPGLFLLPVLMYFCGFMATPRTVAFHTLGCKLNYSETSSIRRMFEDRGYTTLDYDMPADLYVVNTCSVTDFADQKCRQVVRKALRNNPQARVIVTGCYAQLKPEEIARIPGVSLVLGAGEKFRILEYLDTLTAGEGGAVIHAGDLTTSPPFEQAFSFGDRTRSFLKVQDGCDYKCTFCTIPQARGASRSPDIGTIVRQAGFLAEAGAKEIVLTGVNIGDFGHRPSAPGHAPSAPRERFIDLFQTLDARNFPVRFRISSIEPNLCDDALIDGVAASSSFMPHFHMPLQSGSNRILRLMKRRYNRELYAGKVARIRQAMPHACIGVDVITGFPGESDADFQETVDFILDLDISYLHVFTYSERAHTPAAVMNDPVPMPVRKKRNEILRKVSLKKTRAFCQTHAGTVRPVLLEQGKIPGYWNGFTDNYIPMRVPQNWGRLNEVIDVTIGPFGDDGVCTAQKVTPVGQYAG